MRSNSKRPITLRPWLHGPVLVLGIAVVVAIWVMVRDVPLERSGSSPVLAGPLAKLPPPSPKGVLQGVLLDEQGQPVAEADLSTQQDGRVLWAKTDPNGQFELNGLYPGPLMVAIMTQGRLPESIALAGPQLGARLQLTRVPKEIPTLQAIEMSNWAGRVRNPINRKQLQGFQVWLVPVQEADDLAAGIPRRTLTDEKGDFLITDLIHAPYQMHVLPPGFEGSLQPNLLVPLGSTAPILDHGAAATPSEWTLQAGELFGSVRAEGRPVRAAMVMLEALSVNDTESGQSRILPALQTDETGTWSVSNLPPARYRIQVRGGGLNLEKEIILGANQRLRIDM